MSSSRNRAHLARPTAVEALRRHWIVGLTIAILGAAAGVALAFFTPTTVTAESRLAVGTGAVGADALPGVPYASAQFAANYARYLDTQALTSRTGAVVDASQIPDSNIVRVEASASSADAAVAAADEAASALQAKVAEAEESGKALLKRFRTLTARWSQAQSDQVTAQIRLSTTVAKTDPASSPEEVRQAQRSLSTTSSRLAEAQLLKDDAASKYQRSATQVGQADLVVVQQARVTGSSAQSLRVRYGMLGAALGLVLALVVSMAIESRRHRIVRARRLDRPHA